MIKHFNKEVTVDGYKLTIALAYGNNPNYAPRFTYVMDFRGELLQGTRNKLGLRMLNSYGDVQGFSLSREETKFLQDVESKLADEFHEDFSRWRDDMFKKALSRGNANRVFLCKYGGEFIACVTKPDPELGTPSAIPGTELSLRFISPSTLASLKFNMNVQMGNYLARAQMLNEKSFERLREESEREEQELKERLKKARSSFKDMTFAEIKAASGQPEYGEYIAAMNTLPKLERTLWHDYQGSCGDPNTIDLRTKFEPHEIPDVYAAVRKHGIEIVTLQKDNIVNLEYFIRAGFTSKGYKVNSADEFEIVLGVKS